MLLFPSGDAVITETVQALGLVFGYMILISIKHAHCLFAAGIIAG